MVTVCLIASIFLFSHHTCVDVGRKNDVSVNIVVRSRQRFVKKYFGVTEKNYLTHHQLKRTFYAEP